MLSALNSFLTSLLQYSAIQQVEMSRHGTIGCFRMYAGLLLRRQARKSQRPTRRSTEDNVKSAEAIVVFSIRIA